MGVQKTAAGQILHILEAGKEDFDTRRFSNLLHCYFNQGLSYVEKSLQSLGTESS